jgi:hypothetical protein
MKMTEVASIPTARIGSYAMGTKRSATSTPPPIAAAQRRIPSIGYVDFAAVRSGTWAPA